MILGHYGTIWQSGRKFAVVVLILWQCWTENNRMVVEQYCQKCVHATMMRWIETYLNMSSVRTISYNTHNIYIYIIYIYIYTYVYIYIYIIIYIYIYICIYIYIYHNILIYIYIQIDR